MQKRKRIALFANGWSFDYIQETGDGIRRCAKEANVDVFTFIDFSAHLTFEEEKKGEFNIFLLPELKDFDGVLLMTSTFNLEREKDYLSQKIKELSLPAISMDYKLDGIDYFGFDNYPGMYELAMHLFGEHQVQRAVFIGGIPGHADSDTRLRAVQDAARENGRTIREEDILYGSWAGAEASIQLGKWLEEHGELPDAVICANDTMAVGVCDWLAENGYRVPDDVLVTGYDCISSAQEYLPAITSVNHDWADMGYRVLQKLLDKIDGKEVSPSEMMQSKMVLGGSCGCHQKGSSGNLPDELGRVVARKKLDAVATDQHFRHLYTSLRKVETISEFHDSLSFFFRGAHEMEGDTLMLCVRTDYFILEEDEENFRIPGYGDEMDVVCYLLNGMPGDYRRMPTRDAVFMISENRDQAGIYIFVPIRSDDKNLGFAMLSRDLNVVGDSILYMWTRHFNQYMEQVRLNVKVADLTRKLRELSVTDVLTGLYNRMGCEKHLYPFAEACQKRGGRTFVMLADIDRMKTINDQYGHGNGDCALQTVAYVLKTELPEGFLAARFGGDEFFIVGEAKGDISIEAISERLSGRLKKEVERRQFTFPLTMSVGGIRLEAGEEFRLMDCLQRVDEYMYRVKEEHHRIADMQE